jgi:hypothetical protein
LTCALTASASTTPTKQEAEDAARIARVQCERGNVLVTSGVFSKRQILDAQVAFNLLKGTNVTLAEAVCDYLDRHHFGASVELSNRQLLNATC